MTTTNFPNSIQNLKTGITLARASKQNQGVDQLQIQFLSRLQRIRKSVTSISSMIQAVETVLSPQPNWRSTLNLSSINAIFDDFSKMAGTGSFDIVGKYDNIDLQLDPVVQRIKNDCNKVWLTSRDTILSTVPLDFEAPNEQILKVIDPLVKLPASFTTLQRRLKIQRSEEFTDIWKDCDDDPSKFANYVTDLKDSILQYKNSVDPVLNALSKTNPKVAQFLSDATRGEATMRQASASEIKDWLANDQKLLDSFLVRFKDDN